MDTSQNNENTNSQNDGKNTNPKPEDKPSIGLSILSFIFPLIGFILAAINWKSKPISAKRYLIVSAVSFALFIIINISSKNNKSNQVPQATANADNTQTTANAGKLSLYDAVKKGDVEAVKTLIASGANVNEKIEGNSPLHEAVINFTNNNCKIDIVKALIDAGADVNAEGKHGDSPLRLVAGAGSLNKCTNEFEIAKTLIASGANVNQKGMWGLTPLHGAALENISIVRLLISSGADVNARSDDGRTPIYEHVRYNTSVDPDMIKLLISSGADVNIATNEGKTPLDKAKEQKKEDAIKILRQYGAK